MPIEGKVGLLVGSLSLEEVTNGRVKTHRDGAYYPGVGTVLSFGV